MAELFSYDSPLSIASVTPHILRSPLRSTVQTPMGAANAAVSLFVEVRTTDGERGWGEIWCNYPKSTAYHRAAIVKGVAEPFLKSRTFAGPSEAWDAFSEGSNVLRLMSGETGPIRAVIAGIDIALWDIVGKRVGKPLWEIFGGKASTVRPYATLAKTNGAEAFIEEGIARGFQGFKLRCWGDPAQYMSTYRWVRAAIGPDLELMADANSSWGFVDAPKFAHAFKEVNLAFLEEPISVDAPPEVWDAIKAASPTPLAGGENVISTRVWDAAFTSKVFGVLQPDITKWGGFSACVPLAKRIVASGIRLCPHAYSGAPGMQAAATLLASANAPDGLLEFGIEQHPSRDDFLRSQLVKGVIDIGEEPGLGVTIDEQVLRRLENNSPN